MFPFRTSNKNEGWNYTNILCRRFSGDESFDSKGTVVELDAGSGLGVVIEGKKNSPSRL